MKKKLIIILFINIIIALVSFLIAPNYINKFWQLAMFVGAIGGIILIEIPIIAIIFIKD